MIEAIRKYGIVRDRAAKRYIFANPSAPEVRGLGEKGWKAVFEIIHSIGFDEKEFLVNVSPSAITVRRNQIERSNSQ